MRTKMRKGLQLTAFLGVASLAAAMPWARNVAAEKAHSRAESRAEAGGRAFRAYCASCHGASAEGNGPMAEVLKVRPADLTRIRERNGGSFPAEKIGNAIDGRLEIRGHGPGSMPVWGLSFRESGKDSDQEREVRERIADLVAFLESVQK